MTTSLPPKELLARCKEIERRMGRVGFLGEHVERHRRHLARIAGPLLHQRGPEGVERLRQGRGAAETGAELAGATAPQVSVSAE